MSIESVQSFATGAAGARRRTRSASVPRWLHRTLHQVLYITPLFWFMELLQNYGYLLVLGHWGWRYPDALGNLPKETYWYDWHSLKSLGPWASTVVVFSVLDRYFSRHRLPFVLRMVIAGGIGWFGEYSVGYLGANYFKTYLQVWPGTPLTFISISALPIWCLDFLFFHLLTNELRAAREGR